MERVALVREVSSRLGDCELTHHQRRALDLGLARREHRDYVAALEKAGCRVEWLPALDSHPDGVFVEDTVVVLEEVAVLTHPGAVSRRGEVASMEAALRSRRKLRRIEAPATLDGGDVLRIGKTLFVGSSTRSDLAGHAALAGAVGEFGYDVVPVPLRGCLHLKTAVTPVGETTLLLDPACVDREAFAGYDLVEIDPQEPHAANALWLGDVVVFPRRFPRTADRLRAAGLDLRPVALTQLGLAEGGVTCCCVLLEEKP